MVVHSLRPHLDSKREIHQCMQLKVAHAIIWSIDSQIQNVHFSITRQRLATCILSAPHAMELMLSIQTVSSHILKLVSNLISFAAEADDVPMSRVGQIG